MAYFWLSLAIVFTVINFTLLYRSRKFKQRAQVKYDQMIGHLKDITMKRMKKEGLYFDETYPFVSDIDEGYLLCLDTKNRKLAFSDADSVGIYDYDDIEDSEVLITWSQTKPNYYDSVAIKVDIAGRKEPLVITLGHKPKKSTGFFGKFIIDTAGKIHYVMQDIIAGGSGTFSTESGENTRESQ